MYDKKLEKWTEKVLQADTIEVSDEMVSRAEELFFSLSKKELIEKILALEFNKLYKKVEKDDLNILMHADRRDDRFGKKKDFSAGESRKEGRGFSGNPHMDVYFVNIGKIDNVHPGVLVDILAGYGGLTKKQIGNIDIQKRHTLVEIDKKISKTLDSGKILKYRGRRITLKRETYK
jgi:ATP-dependent RNA helicase DeaD